MSIVPKRVVEKLIKQSKLTRNYNEILDIVTAQKTTGSDINHLVKSPTELMEIANLIRAIEPKNPIIHTLYGLASDLGHEHAILLYSQGCFQGKNKIMETLDRKELIDRGKKLLKDLAESKQNASAHYCLALYHVSTKNESDAFYHMQRAADLGDKTAQFQIANWYFKGDVKRNPKLAFEYMQKAHQQGLTEATYLLGTYYEMGIVTKDVNSAYQLYKEAAEKGLAVAQHNTGIAMLQGDHLPKNTILGTEYLKLASKQGFQPSQFNLATCYATGAFGVEIDKSLAKKYLEMAKSKPFELQEMKQKAIELEETIKQIPEKCTIL